MIDGINGRLPVLIFGSRNWPDRPFIWNVLSMLLDTHGDLIVFHGACPTGADNHAEEWVKSVSSRSASKCLRFTAHWEAEGRSAGPLRNRRMAWAFKQAGGTIALAFRVGGTASRGTASCLRECCRIGIKPTIFDFETIYEDPS